MSLAMAAKVAEVRMDVTADGEAAGSHTVLDEEQTVENEFFNNEAVEDIDSVTEPGLA